MAAYNGYEHGSSAGAQRWHYERNRYRQFLHFCAGLKYLLHAKGKFCGRRTWGAKLQYNCRRRMCDQIDPVWIAMTR